MSTVGTTPSLPKKRNPWPVKALMGLVILAVLALLGSFIADRNGVRITTWRMQQADKSIEAIASDVITANPPSLQFSDTRCHGPTAQDVGWVTSHSPGACYITKTLVSFADGDHINQALEDSYGSLSKNHKASRTSAGYRHDSGGLEGGADKNNLRAAIDESARSHDVLIFTVNLKPNNHFESLPDSVEVFAFRTDLNDALNKVTTYGFPYKHEEISQILNSPDKKDYGYLIMLEKGVTRLNNALPDGVTKED